MGKIEALLKDQYKSRIENAAKMVKGKFPDLTHDEFCAMIKYIIYDLGKMGVLSIIIPKNARPAYEEFKNDFKMLFSEIHGKMKDIKDLGFKDHRHWINIFEFSKDHSRSEYSGRF